ncbi:phosphate acyltransferase PlsX [Crocinitomicaceae bacterium]|jgi:glycerol-3-phosphate acyltransferase PlsX|nr:phosphate acyltransferase PlsX [Flavobacteriales bacterium]MBT5933298.1 phosphate acyltransferase PlsX [Flavobacteriales bacterium]MDC0460288.1 phosphate acyltransferase PlsX [Crocinitomicaceae bacterium]MDC1266787.1 phosphate acyltransferase PlsX [Crocinitomicaceae bacterium]MDC3308818.1 phosphate acyltransferase PlsX [Crocinitomicaceae bacterium]
MRIGLDVSGGDFAPKVNLEGLKLAMKELPSCTFYLFGNKEEVLEHPSFIDVDQERVQVVHAPEQITFKDNPTRAILRKPKSSISVGLNWLSTRKIDVFSGTGNTGAMLVGSIYKSTTIPGVIRPCITSTLPTITGGKTVLLDVGSNADCKADVLSQFAVLGSIYAQHVYGKKKPKVALLNIGEEESKGNLLTIAAHELLKSSDEINFIGNLEGRDIFTGIADVIVCDGYTGNVVLKQAEGIYSLIKKRGINDEYFDRFNYENYGGTPILGIRGNVIIGHGISNDIAIKNMLLHSYEVASSGLAKKIKKAFK